MLGALRYNMSVIGLGNDEAMANAVMVREDSPILKTKGYNKEYPNIYGSPESVRGKTILCTRVTSADYALHLWLNALGLKESDIVLKNLEQAPAMTAFDYNIGDAVVLWAPFTFVGDKRGWKTVGTPKDLGKHLPIVLVANTAYATQYPDVTANFLALYLRGVNWLQTAPREEVVKQFQKFYLDWAGQDYSTDLINLNFDTYEFFNLEAQQKALQHVGRPQPGAAVAERTGRILRFRGPYHGEESQRNSGQFLCDVQVYRHGHAASRDQAVAKRLRA